MTTETKHIRQYNSRTCFGCAAACAVGDQDLSLINSYLKRAPYDQLYSHREIGAYLLFRGLIFGTSAINPNYRVIAVEDKNEFVPNPIEISKHEAFCFVAAAKSRGMIPQEAFDELIENYISTSGIDPQKIADIDPGGIPGTEITKKVVLGFIDARVPMWQPAILIVRSSLVVNHAVYWDGGGKVFDSARDEIGRLEDYHVRQWFPLTRIAPDPLASDPLWPIPGQSG